MERSTTNDFRVFPHGADIAFLSSLKTEDIRFLLGNNQGTLIDGKDEFAQLKRMAGNRLQRITRNAINYTGFNGGCDNLGRFTQEIAFNTDDHIPLMTDVFCNGGVVFLVMLQHHSLVHIEHTVTHITLADQMVSTQNFHGYEDVSEGMQCLHIQCHIVGTTNVSCHIATSVIQVDCWHGYLV